jgi:hypothetical protein
MEPNRVGRYRRRLKSNFFVHLPGRKTVLLIPIRVADLNLALKPNLSAPKLLTDPLNEANSEAWISNQQMHAVLQPADVARRKPNPAARELICGSETIDCNRIQLRENHLWPCMHSPNHERSISLWIQLARLAGPFSCGDDVPSI